MRTGTGKGGAAAYLSMFRLGNCIMGAFGTLLAAIICGGIEGVEDFVLEIALSMLIVFVFTAAGNTLNDYYDRDVDKVAHPARPIPSGLVSPRAARTMSATLFAVALGASVFVNIWAVSIVVTSAAVMVGYEVFLKAEGLAGNLAIGWLTGALFLFGGAAVESLELAWILAALAFLATLGREIVKDVQDIAGDKGVRRTLPLRVGSRRAGAAASVAFVAAVALSPAPYLLDLLSAWYLPVVLAADAIFIYCALIHFRSPEQGQKAAKLAMLVALVAFLVGGVF